MKKLSKLKLREFRELNDAAMRSIAGGYAGKNGYYYYDYYAYPYLSQYYYGGYYSYSGESDTATWYYGYDYRYIFVADNLPESCSLWNCNGRCHISGLGPIEGLGNCQWHHQTLSCRCVPDK